MSRFIDAIDYIIDLGALIAKVVVLIFISSIVGIVFMLVPPCIWMICIGNIQGIGFNILEAIGFAFGFILTVRILTRESD